MSKAKLIRVYKIFLVLCALVYFSSAIFCVSLFSNFLLTRPTGSILCIYATHSCERVSRIQLNLNVNRLEIANRVINLSENLFIFDVN